MLLMVCLPCFNMLTTCLARHGVILIRAWSLSDPKLIFCWLHYLSILWFIRLQARYLAATWFRVLNRGQQFTWTLLPEWLVYTVSAYSILWISDDHKLCMINPGLMIDGVPNNRATISVKAIECKYALQSCYLQPFPWYTLANLSIYNS